MVILNYSNNSRAWSSKFLLSIWLKFIKRLSANLVINYAIVGKHLEAFRKLGRHAAFVEFPYQAWSRAPFPSDWLISLHA